MAAPREMARQRLFSNHAVAAAIHGREEGACSMADQHAVRQLELSGFHGFPC